MPIPTGGVAFFDSGIGGLTVLYKCLPYLQGETIYYYGDNKRAPYGNLPPTTIKQYVGEAFQLFSLLNVKAAVIACNTATAICAKELREKYSFPIIGAEPALLPAAKAGGEVFVLCTRRTFESERFAFLCQKARKLYPLAKIRPIACDGLAGEIERHSLDKKAELAKFLPKGNPQGVVLGCTHYVYYKKEIENFYHCPVYDGNEGICRQLLSFIQGNISTIVENQPLDCNFCPRGENFIPKSLVLDLPFNGLTAQKTDECSKVAKVGKKSNATSLYFWGSGQQNNKKQCEQMFVWDFWG